MWFFVAINNNMEMTKTNFMQDYSAPEIEEMVIGTTSIICGSGGNKTDDTPDEGEIPGT